MRVLITGANRGIGRALYDGYVARGDEVVATTRNQASDGWLQLDVTDPASVSAMATQLKGEAIDLLICNAGVYLDKGKELGNGYTSNVWADTFAANVTGVFLTIEALLSNLRAVGGKVAIISSQMGSSERAGGNAFAYRASKAAALNLGRNLAVDLSPDVAVGIYHPGWVQTDMGGPNGLIDVETSALGLKAILDNVGKAESGKFYDYSGKQLPW